MVLGQILNNHILNRMNPNSWKNPKKTWSIDLFGSGFEPASILDRDANKCLVTNLINLFGLLITNYLMPESNFRATSSLLINFPKKYNNQRKRASTLIQYIKEEKIYSEKIRYIPSSRPLVINQHEKLVIYKLVLNKCK